MRSIYAALVRAGVLASNPARESRAPPVHTGSVPVLSRDEFRRVLAYRPVEWADRRALLVVLTAGLTGLRRSSLATLRVQDFVDGTPPRLKIEGAKGGKSAELAIPDELAVHLRSWVRDGAKNFLFGTRRNAALTDRTIRREFERVAVACQIPVAQLTPHAMRRSFATHSYLAGIPIEKIQQALMHESPAVTMRYIKANLASVEAIGNKLNDYLQGEK